MTASEQTETLLTLADVGVSYRSGSASVRATTGVSFTVARGETVAVVGESGSGKSTTAHAVIRLLPSGGRLETGTVVFDGTDLTRLSESGMRAIRGRRIGLVPQDPMMALNPVQRIGRQVAETLHIHGLADADESASRAEQLLVEAGLDSPRARMQQYPHELSGGMRQRVLIASALACRPELVIADEPTSALDVTVQRHILDRIEQLTHEVGSAVLLITHDLAVAADRAQKLVVMRRGEVVESGPAEQILTQPAHPYTRQLLNDVPGFGGRARRVAALPGKPSAGTADPLLSVRGLRRRFPLPPSSSGRSETLAVDDVSFDIAAGETLGIVGESGSGKSTTARLVLRLDTPDAGSVRFGGQDITALRGTRLRSLRRRFQMVYQNPYGSLDPRLTVGAAIAEPLRVHRVCGRAERERRARGLLDQVGLPQAMAARKPAELSGGQRQRVAIARALALEPDLLVCDEPVSALDVTAQAQVLELLARLQAERRLAYLFITHDLAVVQQISHRVGVMYRGRLVECGPTQEVFAHPRHDYTRELLGAVPGTRGPSHQDSRRSAPAHDLLEGNHD
ncbi:dipeptide ABC transporter ATP-binding protein [Streptomyces umbrinus]|uniref:dipeptide ABC transporter ATP-binding protein n=1 Tax=Streptomyces umbrinus TaxID=67370 RepID=UPI003C30208E